MSAGCASQKSPNERSYQTIGSEPKRDSDVAKRENARGVQSLAEKNYAEAERTFKTALDADILFGPAHNNLGKAYFKQGKFYLAAWEFQYAAKLMPNQPEPLNNLGLVFESAGKLDDAVSAYDKAIGLEPDHVEILGNLARARIRRGDRDESVRQLLDKLILRETRPDWADWARERLARMQAKSAGE